MSNIDKLKEFHKKANYPINDKLNLDTRESEMPLRVELLKEEFSEYLRAEYDNDIVEVADGLADMLYIIYGTALTYGIPLDRIFDEVHRSNMTKFTEGVIVRDDGKILKGKDFEEPKLREILYDKESS